MYTVYTYLNIFDSYVIVCRKYHLHLHVCVCKMFMYTFAMCQCVAGAHGGYGDPYVCPPSLQIGTVASFQLQFVGQRLPSSCRKCTLPGNIGLSALDAFVVQCLASSGM